MNKDKLDGAGKDTGSFLFSNIFWNCLAMFGLGIFVVDVLVVIGIALALHNV